MNKHDTRIHKHGNYIHEHTFIPEALVFTFTGNEVGVAVNSSMSFTFTTAASVTIDYGNGTVITYNSTGSGVNNSIVFGTSGGAYNYTYPDGLTILRTVKVTVNNPTVLKDFLFRKTINNPVWNIGQFTGLKIISVRGLFSSANLQGSFNNNLDSVTYQPENANTIPIDLCYSAAKSLTVYTNANTANIDQLYHVRGLETLSLDWFHANAYSTGNPLPPTIALMSLKVFNCFVATTTTVRDIPAYFNNMVTLTSLQWYFDRTTWPDFSLLVNLTTLSVVAYTNVNLVPSFLMSINLKRIVISQFASNQTAAVKLSKINEAIDTMYTWAVANAPITGTSANKARSQRREFTAGQVVKPDGVYQAPAGYVLGSANGTPASQLEKLYVLVNQYAWIFTNIPLT